MNLNFNIRDDLFWINNFLPTNIYKNMYIEFIKNRKKLNFKKSIVSWPTFKEEVDDLSESYDQNNYLNLDFYKEYHLLLRHQRFVNFLNYDFKSHLRLYKYGQHLTWHDDHSDEKTYKRKYAATFYFNKTWRESWGGELMFKSNNESGFIPIVGNSLVIVKTGMRHKVNSNLKKTHPRLSIQTWIDYSN
tara:strand:- start:1786 stop:2352 length:567 start_codon:yes stop_codon:yes gene_type:complete